MNKRVYEPRSCVARTLPSTMSEASKATVMEGSLQDFSLADILQVLSVSPEYTRIELTAEDRSPAGAIVLKSGKIVQSVAGGDRGSEAFFSLIQRKLGFFKVYRDEPNARVLEPI